MILALTPLLRELNGGGRDYEKKARLRLVELTEMENIPFIDFLPEFDAIGNAKEIYHDHIHFNLQGNQQITQRLLKTIRPFL
jgi:lysophospholipase L1-like esterase